MNVALQTGARPPHIDFYEGIFEDRAKSLEAGHFVARSVDMVRIRQAGSKDSVEKDAESWLKTLHQNPNMLPDWVVQFKAMYAQYKEGLEPVANGTHIRDWGSISQAQQKTLLASGVRTVEDLALANEPLLQRVGMDARALQNKAKAWLDAAKGTGKTAAELDELRTRTKQQDEAIAELRQLVAELRAKVPAPGAKTVAEEDDFLGATKKGK
jgi:hypothetical protein